MEGTIPSAYRTSKFDLKVTPLHPTFACQLEDVDFSKPVSPELYAEIREVVDKVGLISAFSWLIGIHAQLQIHSMVWLCAERLASPMRPTSSSASTSGSWMMFGHISKPAESIV
jgi:hypothetical protein